MNKTREMSLFSGFKTGFGLPRDDIGNIVIVPEDKETTRGFFANRDGGYCRFAFGTKTILLEMLKRAVVGALCGACCASPFQQIKCRVNCWPQQETCPSFTGHA